MAMVQIGRFVSFAIAWVLLGFLSFQVVFTINWQLSNFDGGSMYPAYVWWLVLGFLVFIIPLKSFLLAKVLGLRGLGWGTTTAVGTIFGITITIIYGWIMALLS